MVTMTLNSGTSKHKFTKEEKRAYWEPFRTNGKYAIRNFFQEMKSYPNLLDRLHTHIKSNPLPTAIIWGQEDPILRGEIQIPLIQRDFNVDPLDVHLIGGAKHFIQEESPEIVQKFILEFLAK